MKKLLTLLLLTFYTLGFAQNQSQTIGFIENKGQIVDQKGKSNKAVKYLLNTNGLNVQLRQNGFSYDVYETQKIPLTAKEQKKAQDNYLSKEKSAPTQDYRLEYTYHRIDIDFINSNIDVQLVAEERSNDFDNYYNVVSRPEGVLDVHKYQKVTYVNVYPNIDVVFFIPEDKSKPVEYNFVIKPNGRIDAIQMKFSGAKTELVDNKIKMDIRFGAMEETLPMSWTENGNDKKTINISYKKIKNNVYGFESSASTTGRKIIIDPTPNRLWGTYCGGDNMSLASTSINVDSLENVILTGTTYCSNIATSGAFITNNSGYDESGFIIKFNSNGQRIWASYIKNGNLFAKINDAEVNSNNEIYVVGQTWDGGNGTNSLATPGSHKQFPSILTSEGFILKFNSNGLRIWGTFFGGVGTDQIHTSLLDADENIVICGSTDSNSGIALSGGFLPNRQLTPTYDNGGFFCKFSPTGTQLYGSYFYASITNCVKDAANNYFFGGIYVMGSGYPNITTTGCHQSQYYNLDTYLVKFNSGLNLDWCTYYGGNGYETLTGLGTDSQNNVYLIGSTYSPENIATPGSFKDTLINGENAYIAKFNTNGQRIWGTYFGRNGSLVSDKCNNGFVKENGDVFITGETRFGSPALSTSNAFQPISNGSDEGFFAKFTTNGNLSWSSYYGTISQDYSQKIYYKNYLYIAGYSSGVATNGNNLGTPGTFMPNGGGYLLFLAKFQDCLSSPVVNSIPNICIGEDLNLTASGGTNYSWTGPNGFTSAQQNPTIINANATHSGQYSCNITGTGGCDGVISVNVVVGDITKPIPDVLNLPILNGDCNLVIPIPTATDNCSGVLNGATANPIDYPSPGSYNFVWTYTDANGNTETQNQTIVISAVTLPVVTSPQTFCIQQNTTINDIAITGQNVQWYDAPTGGNLLSSTTILQNGVTYYASQTLNSCESSRVPVVINIQNTPTPISNSPQTFCAVQNPTLNDIVITGTAINWYSSNTSTTALQSNTLLSDGTTYYATQTVNGCESINRLPITVGLIFSLNANDYATNVCDEANNGTEMVDLSQFDSYLVSGLGNTFTYYKSYNGAENQIAGEQLNTNHTINLGLNIIFVRIDSANGCHQIVQLQLTLVSVPVILIPDEVILCERNVISVHAGSGFNSYHWSTNATTPSIAINQAGNYSVTVTKNHGSVVCSSTKNFTVVLSNAPTITAIDVVDWTDTENSITVHASGLGDYEYSIDGINFQNSNIFNALPNGAYLVTVRDKKECGMDTEQVFLLNYPKFFTPNSDGNNDRWSIKFSQFEPNLEVRIFDRYGKLLRVMSNDEAWDGSYNGRQLPSDDYWFTVIRNDGRIHKGHFAMLR